MRKMIKKLCSVTMAAVMVLGAISIPAMADAPAPVKTVEYVTGNILVDGSFENGVAGWTATDATISHTITDTYNNTAGAGVVTRTAENGYISQDVSIRKYTWYTYSVAVKLAEGEGTASVKLDYTADTWNDASTKKFDAVAVNSTDWTVLEGYFLKSNQKNTQTFNKADFFQTAKVSLNVSGDKAYYVDEFSIKMHDGFYNSDFSDDEGNPSDAGWNYTDNDLKMNAVSMAVRKGTEADGAEAVGKNIMHVSIPNNGNGLGQAICLEQDVEYEIYAKVKITTDNVIDTTENNYVRFRVNNAFPLNMNSEELSHYVGIAPLTSADKWITLRLTYTYTGNNPYFYIYPRIHPVLNKGTAAAKGLEYDVIDFQLKRKTNIFNNPYLEATDAGTGSWASSTGWKLADNLTLEATVYNGHLAPTPIYDTSDNSNSRLKVVPKLIYPEPPAEQIPNFYNASLYQNEKVLEPNRRYNISFDIRADEELPASYNLLMRHYGSENSNSYPLGDESRNITTEWQTVTKQNCSISLPEGYTNSEIALYFTGVDNKPVYVDNFVIEPSYQSPRITKPVISSAVAGKKLTAPEITVADSADAYSLRYRYLISDDEDGTNKAPIATGHTVVGKNIPGIDIPASCEGKYLTLEVTGVSDKGVWATAVESEPVEVTGLYTITPANGAGYTGSLVNGGTITADVTITNKDTVNPMQAAVIIAYYEDGRLADVAVTDKRIAANDDEPFNPSINLPATLGTNPSVKVFVWKGHNGTAFQMQPLTASFPK